MQALTALVLFLAIPFSAAVTVAGLYAVGVPRRGADRAGAAAAAVTLIEVVSLFVTGLAECWGENSDSPPPASWPWSPRLEFCSEGSSPAALGALTLLAFPTVVVMLGTFLWFKYRPALGLAAYALLLSAPVLPSLYINALPYYRFDSYPVLHQPLLRPASASRPPRVCYVYGIAFGPRKAVAGHALRECVELEPTPQARSLTPMYDEGRTIYNLDWVGKNLTEKGLPIRPGETGVAGLVVERAYKLTEHQARTDAHFLPGSLGTTSADG